MTSHRNDAILLALICSAIVVVGFLAGAGTKDVTGREDAASPKHNTAPEGWAALFDGETLDGWKAMSGEAKYTVDDGAILGTTVKQTPNSFLCTEKTYKDFELTFEVLLHDNELNSGCQVRSHAIDQGNKKYLHGRIVGPQIEIMRGAGYSGHCFMEGIGGWPSLYVDGKEVQDEARAAKRHKHFKNGQWNRFRVRIVGDHYQTWVNGEKVADFKMLEKHRERFAEGVIGLQVHAVQDRGPFSVRWRNLYIKEIGE
ncbi:MAG: DUF1080 domain-containing protein [Phycisphaeraceae bacterium]|nr:DUF1080 domain-containing protein [Phycisphaeraceae bacterium]